MTITYLRTWHGTGDTYMTLAFAQAVAEHRKCHVTVDVKPEHKAIADMFPNVVTADLPAAHMVEVVHPSAFSGDISQLAHKDFTSHADLWRCILRLPVDAPMTRGHWTFSPVRNTASRRVFIIPKARSIQNNKPEFWDKLFNRLSNDGWEVHFNNEAQPLRWTFQHCANAEWVIGPQCGVMAILCHALFPCRKTFVTPALETMPSYPVKQTFPYMYATKFAGEDYDVEEHRIADDEDKVVDMIANGPNAKRMMTGQPVSFVRVGMSVGDFLDRYSILLVKWSRFDDQRKAAIAREVVRYNHVAMNNVSKINGHAHMLFGMLMDVNLQIFKQSETIVPDALAGKHLNHDKIIALNKKRVELKNEIDKHTQSAFKEVKSYYGDDVPV